MKPHEEWIEKAERDLKSAKKLSSGEDAIRDTAVYHTQQCAEKALKAFLVYKKQAVKKIHDLEQLIEICLPFDSEFKILIEFVVNINPYSTIFRYPGELFEPDKEDVAEAIDCAEKILNFVKQKTIVT